MCAVCLYGVVASGLQAFYFPDTESDHQYAHDDDSGGDSDDDEDENGDDDDDDADDDDD